MTTVVTRLAGRALRQQIGEEAPENPRSHARAGRAARRAQSALLANVHPPDWLNPEPAARYHLVVIGAGTAGLVSAAGAGRARRPGRPGRAPPAGRRLPERRLRAVEGRDPRLARLARRARRRASASAVRRGPGAPATSPRPWSGCAGCAPASARTTARSASAASASTSSSGDGRFTGPDAVEVGGRRLRFRRAVIATGARAAVPPIPGLAEAGYLHQRDGLQADRAAGAAGGHRRRPDRLRAGPGLRPLRRRVTLLDMDAHDPAPRGRRRRRDRPAGAARATASSSCSARRSSRSRRRGRETTVVLERDGERRELAADHAPGRGRPRAERRGPGPGSRGRARTTKTGVEVDDQLRTTNPQDLRRRRHRLALPVHPRRRRAGADRDPERALLRPREGERPDDALVHLHHPEVAHVGLYEKDAREKGIAVDTLTVPLDDGGPRGPRRRRRGLPARAPEEGHRPASSAPPWSPSTPAT